MSRWLLGGASLCVALMLTACGGGPGHGADATGSADTDATLRVASHLGVTTWDPARMLGGPEIPLASLVYDRLIHLDSVGALHPGLAESWEFEDGGTALVLNLRDGEMFSDGTPITAEVVAANIERARTLPESTVAGSLSNVTSVTVDGDDVRIEQAEPDSGIVALLTERPGMIVSPDTFDNLSADDMPIGSGPFILTAQQPDVSMSLSRNTDYWNADAFDVAQVEISIIADSTARLNAVRTDQIDLARIEPEQVEDAKTAPGVNATSGPLLELGALWLNEKLQPAFADPDVRRAMSLALDRQLIVDGVLFGEATATTQYFPEGHPAHVPELNADLGPDLEEARALLADAGYPEGFRFEATVLSPKLDRVAQAVQSQLAEVGISVDLRPLPGFGTATEFTSGKVAAQVMSMIPRAEPNLTFRTNFLAPQFLNPGGTTDPEMAELVRASIAETEADKRLEIDHQISQRNSEHPMAIIPLYALDQIVISRDEIHGVQTWLSSFPYLEGISVSN